MLVPLRSDAVGSAPGEDGGCAVVPIEAGAADASQAPQSDVQEMRMMLKQKRFGKP